MRPNLFLEEPPRERRIAADAVLEGARRALRAKDDEFDEEPHRTDTAG